MTFLQHSSRNKVDFAATENKAPYLKDKVRTRQPSKDDFTSDGKSGELPPLSTIEDVQD